MEREMWRCRRCGRRFANRNQWHSCGRFRTSDHLRGKPKDIVAIYDGLVAMLREVGPIRLHPVKTRIGVIDRVTFCEIDVGRDRVDGHLLLPRRIEDPRFTSAVEGPRIFLHRFRLRSLDDLDETFRGYLQEAATIGRQEHLAPWGTARMDGRSIS